MKKNLFALLALLSVSTAYAGGGGISSGGATEATQVLNKLQLIEQTGHALNTVTNTMATAEATMQQIRQLDPGTISALVGVPIGTVQTMATAYGVFSKASSVYTDAAAVLRKAQSDAAMLKVSPSTLLNMKAQTAYAYGGQYKASYDAEQAKLAALSSTSKDVQAAANSLGGMDSTVKGVQTLAAQNLQMQTQLSSINESISQANALAYQQAIDAKNAEAIADTKAALSADETIANQAISKAAIDSLDTYLNHIANFCRSWFSGKQLRNFCCFTNAVRRHFLINESALWRNLYL